MKIQVDKDELVKLLRRTQSFVSTIAIYNGKDPQELDLYHLEAQYLRDRIYEYTNRIVGKDKHENRIIEHI